MPDAVIKFFAFLFVVGTLLTALFLAPLPVFMVFMVYFYVEDLKKKNVL